MPYQGKRVLVTGGLGFIGSNLSIRLAELGAKVTIIDNSVDGCGANEFNIATVRDRVRVIPLDIADSHSIGDVIAKTDVVFNLAGEISHVHSMQFPERDLQINALAQLRFVLACRDFAPGIRVVYASTRQVYGSPDCLPVDETHPVHPIDFNGIHKYAAGMYHLMFHRTEELDPVILRLTNVYGPRMAINIPCQGFLSTFFRRLLLDQPVEVFGDGNQLRDPVYVDDAVEAFLIAGQAARLPSRTYNVGGPNPLRVSEIAEIATAAARQEGYSVRPFPEERKAIDIGSYYTDSSKIREELGWTPKCRFSAGVERTLEYFRSNLNHYIDPNQPAPACNMLEHSGKTRKLMTARA